MSSSVGISCGGPGTPSNGRVNASAGTLFGKVAIYSYDTRYTLNGPAERACQADGQWSGSVPTCDNETQPAAINCTSVCGTGCTFTFVLPVAFPYCLSIPSARTYFIFMCEEGRKVGTGVAGSVLSTPCKTQTPAKRALIKPW